MSVELLAYCVKCKEKRPVENATPVFTKAAQPATRGECGVCGTSLYRMGATHAHEGLTPPKPVRKKGAKGKNGKTAPRRGKLVIVESPAKAKTIENYLGKGYKVRASVGHIRDLLKSRLSVDVEHDFEPEYRVPNDKREVVKELKSAVDRAKEVYLATDPDREGEAIAWHVMEATELEPERARRVVFYEVTGDAVREAFEDPHEIDMNLVEAQQARRILDRLVGYELSPLLWKKVRPRLSAGRVQSVAVRIVVERERVIEAFVPEEFWTIDADLAREVERDMPERLSFRARLQRIKGEDIHLPTEDVVRPIVAELEDAEYIVDSVKKGQRKRRPSAPFITSTIQQEASRRLGFRTRKVMAVAQQLYEGIDIGDGGAVGLITYMRTDSTNVSAQAQSDASKYIKDTFGKEYLPAKPNVYSRKSKGAQEAHEAIRPTSVTRTPEALKAFLTRDQYRLYNLIWQRFVASQMAAAIYDTLRVDILAGAVGTSKKEKPYEFRASGSILQFSGFLAVYEDKSTEDDPENEGLGLIFPDLINDDPLDLLELFPDQHFTQPPSRYTEASLVKALEENGIGRPSTYASIMNTIQQRGYVERDGKVLHPTDIGGVVNDLLVENFPNIVDLDFTAQIEDTLDQIASGEQDWVPMLREFYDPFKAEVEWARENVPNVDLGEEQIGRDCPECGNPLIIRWGRYGKFIGCSTFPTCRFTEPWLEKINITCPLCQQGEIVERKTRKGRTFYGCERYPECEFTSWKRPLADPCPVCGGLMVLNGKKVAVCTQCEHRMQVENITEVTQAE